MTGSISPKHYNNVVVAPFWSTGVSAKKKEKLVVEYTPSSKIPRRRKVGRRIYVVVEKSVVVYTSSSKSRSSFIRRRRIYVVVEKSVVV